MHTVGPTMHTTPASSIKTPSVGPTVKTTDQVTSVTLVASIQTPDNDTMGELMPTQIPLSIRLATGGDDSHIQRVDIRSIQASNQATRQGGGMSKQSNNLKRLKVGAKSIQFSKKQVYPHFTDSSRTSSNFELFLMYN